MKIKRFNTGIYDVNTYIVTDEKTSETAIIDLGGNFEIIDDYVKANSLKVKYILNTHGHFDHVMGVLDAKNAYKVPFYIHQADEILINNISKQLETLGMYEKITSPQIDVYVDENTNISLGDIPIKIFYTPGHTQGGVCYLIEDNLFSGDTLFYESIGRTDFAYGNHNQLVTSIKQKLFTLSDNITVFPGHGCRTTIGHEKKYNSYVI